MTTGNMKPDDVISCHDILFSKGGSSLTAETAAGRLSYDGNVRLLCASRVCETPSRREGNHNLQKSDKIMSVTLC